MKKLKSKMFRRGIGLLTAAVLILTGCSAPRFCQARLCDRKATKSCYNVDNSEDVEYFCKYCIPCCDMCYNDAVKFKVSDGWKVYVCETCDYWEFLEIIKRGYSHIYP